MSQKPAQGAFVFTGSGWAGDKLTRKFIGEVVAMHRIHCVSFPNRLHKVVALSSRGEAELNTHALGLCEGLGIAMLCEERRIYERVGACATAQLPAALPPESGHASSNICKSSSSGRKAW